MNKFLRKRADREYLYKYHGWVNLLHTKDLTPEVRDSLAYRWIAFKIALKDFIKYFFTGMII